MRCRTKKKLLLRSQEATNQQRYFPLVLLCEGEGEEEMMEDRGKELEESREELEESREALEEESREELVVGHAQFAFWGAIFSTSYVRYVTF